MSDIWTYLEQELAPPGIRAGRRRELFRIIARIGQVVAGDAAKVKREFFAYLTEDQSSHGSSLGIPRFPTDSDESYRGRLSNAATVLSSTGELGGLKDFLDAYVPGRWRIVDAPEDFFRVGFGRIGIAPIGRSPAAIVRLKNPTSSERRNIEAFLEWFLGADIEYVVMTNSYSVPESPLSLEQLRASGGSRWLEYHVGQVAPVQISLLPDDAFAVGSGRGVGLARIYRGSDRGSDDYVVIRCRNTDKKSIEKQLSSLIESSIEIQYKEDK